MATGEDIKTYLLNRVNDPDAEQWDDDTLILRYINNAIIAVSDMLITGKDRTRLESMNITDGMTVPSTFGVFAGQYPIYQVGEEFKLHTGTLYSVMYYKKIAELSTLSGTIDMDEKYVPILGELVVGQAENQVEKASGMTNAITLSEKLQELAKWLF